MSSPRLPLSSRPTFLPDEIARREFATVFRGYDPAEVRTFLNQLSEQQGEISDRVAEIQRALVETQNRVKNPELDEETVTRLLGEQTAQILRSAREAANDTRQKSEEEVSRTLRDAHEVTTRMREEAEKLYAERTESAATKANSVRTEAEQDAETARREADEEVTALRNRVTDEISRLRSETEAEMLSLRQRTQSDLVDERSKARAQARDLIDAARDEARALVERTQERQTELIEGLVRKRKIALAQVEELRAGRQRLLDSYKMVRTTLDEVTGELERVEEEARSAAENAGLRSAQATEISPEEIGTRVEIEEFKLDDDVSAEIVKLVNEDENSGDEDDASAEVIDLVPRTQDARTQDGGETATLSLPGLTSPSGDGSQPGGGGTSGTNSVATLASPGSKTEAVAEPATERPSTSSVSSGLIIGETFSAAEGSDTDRALKLRRDAVVGKFRSQATRRLNRALQDEQDALLARLRSGEGESVQALIGSVEDQAATYHRAIVKLFREVTRSGVTSVEGSTGVERGLVDRTGTTAARSLATELVNDLRSQLQPVLQELLSAGSIPESSVLGVLVAEPYRAVSGGYLEQLVDDRIAGVFDQGVAFAQASSR